MRWSHSINSNCGFVELNEVGVEECLEFVKGASQIVFKIFVQVPMGFLRSWIGILAGEESQERPICGACKERLNILFLRVHHAILTDNF